MRCGFISTYCKMLVTIELCVFYLRIKTSYFSVFNEENIGGAHAEITNKDLSVLSQSKKIHRELYDYYQIHDSLNDIALASFTSAVKTTKRKGLQFLKTK